MSDNQINQNLHNVKCCHCVNLDFGIQRFLLSITDEVKPNVHKQTLYMRETHGGNSFFCNQNKVS